MAEPEQSFNFGPFRLFPDRRLLMEEDQLIRVGARALDILTTLVERAGEVVGKDELIARVWPGTYVVAENLTVHVSALRRALGDGRDGTRYIATIPGRGYSFVASVTRDTADKPAAIAQPQPASAKHDPRHNLPVRLTRLIGQDTAIARLVQQLPERRLLTITGPGGIGKTSLALAVAERLVPEYAAGVWLVDLAPVTQPQHVPTAVAAVLEIETLADDPLVGLTAALRDGPALLVLDNCEHIVDAVADFVSRLLRGAPLVTVLATSRELLRVEGEQIYRIPPLGVPPDAPRLTHADALAFPAVELFVERVGATFDGFELSDADAPIVAELCRRLDGNPLAIELAAPQVAVFGARGLLTHLNKSLGFASATHRAAPAHRRTLQDMLDWSYQLLSERERTVLRRLSVFVGVFPMEAATAVASCDLTETETVECIVNLVCKSLIAAEPSDVAMDYRLLEVTRLFALEKLREGGEFHEAARRHALYHRDILANAEKDLRRQTPTEWLAKYGRQIGNVRVALDWAFSPGGDPAIGMALTVSSVPLWFELFLMEERRRFGEKALASYEQQGAREPHHEMPLRVAAVSSLSRMMGLMPEAVAAWRTTLELAESAGDSNYRLEALWALATYYMAKGEYRAALALAEELCLLAAKRDGAADLVVGERMTAYASFMLGDFASARHYCEVVLLRPDASTLPPRFHRFQYAPRLQAMADRAQVLWFQGYPDRATETARKAIALSQESGNASAVCYALAASACWVFQFTGNLSDMRDGVTLLADRSTEPALALWGLVGLFHRGVLSVRTGDLQGGLNMLSTAITDLRQHELVMVYASYLAVLADTLWDAGRLTEALALLDETFAQADRHDERFYMAELHRLRGKFAAADGAPMSEVEAHYREALDWAERQGALSLALRAGMSLARLWMDGGRANEAHDLMKKIYGRFTEGFETADLRAARALLDALEGAVRQDRKGT